MRNHIHGELSEWSKVQHSKCCVPKRNLGFESLTLRQMDCLICLPDRSGNFLAFKAETRKNTEKSEKTGFGMVTETAPGPVFCVFRPKIPRTFYFKLTEQSSRKKLAEGGFEPERGSTPVPCSTKETLNVYQAFRVLFMQNCGTLCIFLLKSAKTYQNRAKNSIITRRSTIFKVFRR